jgi:hypothetical protein
MQITERKHASEVCHLPFRSFPKREVLILPHGLVEVPDHEPRIRSIRFDSAKSGPHVMSFCNSRFTIHERSPPLGAIGHVLERHIKVPRSIGKQIYFNRFIPKQSDTCTLALTIMRNAILEAKPPPKIFYSGFTLSSLADENYFGVVRANEAHQFLNCPGLPQAPAVPAEDTHGS